MDLEHSHTCPFPTQEKVSLLLQTKRYKGYLDKMPQQFPFLKEPFYLQAPQAIFSHHLGFWEFPAHN